jgi:hypothetical protein
MQTLKKNIPKTFAVPCVVAIVVVVADYFVDVVVAVLA